MRLQQVPGDRLGERPGRPAQVPEVPGHVGRPPRGSRPWVGKPTMHSRAAGRRNRSWRRASPSRSPARPRRGLLGSRRLRRPDRGGDSQILTFSVPENENGPGRLRPSVPIPPCTANRASRLVPPQQLGQNGWRPTSLRLTWRRTFALSGAVGAGRSLTMIGPSTLPL